MRQTACLVINPIFVDSYASHTPLVLILVALWLSLVLCYFVLVFLVILALRLPRLGKREIILVLFVRLFDLRCLVLSVLSSFWCLGKAAAFDCDTPWTFLLPSFHN